MKLNVHLLFKHTMYAEKTTAFLCFMLRDWFRLSLSSLGIFKLTLKKWRKPLKTPWKDLEFLWQKRVGTLYLFINEFVFAGKEKVVFFLICTAIFSRLCGYHIDFTLASHLSLCSCVANKTYQNKKYRLSWQYIDNLTVL